ncbi:MAG: tetratricopeptide repeat protein [Gemmatimonas sp.]|nr:tetratricopeptide repeat protein [Gemmatimonas sp.]
MIDGGVVSAVEDVRRLMEARQYRDVVELASEFDRQQIVDEPELVLPIASSLQHLFRHREARALLDSSAESIRASYSPADTRRWQNLFASNLIEEGNLVEAKNLIEACLSSAEQADHHRMIASSLNNLGVVSSLLGDVEDAVRQFTRSIAVWQRRGYRAGVGRAHHNLGLVLTEWGRYDEAIAHFSLACDYFALVGTPEESTFTSFERAALLLEIGDYELAESLATAALNRAGQLGSLILTSAARKVLGKIVLRRRGPDEARSLLVSAARGAVEAGDRLLIAEVHEELTVLELLAGRSERASRHKQVAVEHFSSLGAVKRVGRMLRRIDELLKDEPKS